MKFINKRNLTLKSATVNTLALLTVTTFPFIFGGNAAHAQNVQPERQFSAATGAIVNQVLEMTNSGEYELVVAQLSKLLNTPSLTPYERSVIYQMQGSSYYELNKYELTIAAFENAIKAGGLLPEEADQMTVNNAQLQIANGHYELGAAALEAYLYGGGERKPQHIEILVQAWIQAGDDAKALPWAEQWFAQANPKKRKHYDMMNYLYANLGKTDYQADIVSQMVLRWPDDESLRNTLSSLRR
ncbi:hypothetical protein N9M10_03040 [Hellea sp.]|nr:hypothetical protein [Hellea sp.]